MYPASISALANASPGSVEVTEMPHDCCGNFFSVGKDEDLSGDVGGDLFGDRTDSTTTAIEGPWGASSLGPHGNDEIDRILCNAQVTEADIYNNAITVAEGLSEVPAQDFPGASGAAWHRLSNGLG